MRRATAALLCLALVPALLQSPFLHAHNDGESLHAREEHSGTSFVLHTHGRVEPEGRASLTSADEDLGVRPLNGFHARQMPVLTLAVEPVILIQVASPPPARSSRLRLLTPRAHGPPARSRRAPRAPPA